MGCTVSNLATFLLFFAGISTFQATFHKINNKPPILFSDVLEAIRDCDKRERSVLALLKTNWVLLCGPSHPDPKYSQFSKSRPPQLQSGSLNILQVSCIRAKVCIDTDSYHQGGMQMLKCISTWAGRPFKLYRL